MDEFQEFPKALYRNGEYCEVRDAQAEKLARRAGWADWTADQEKIAGGKVTEAPEEAAAPEQPQPEPQAQ